MKTMPFANNPLSVTISITKQVMGNINVKFMKLRRVFAFVACGSLLVLGQASVFAAPTPTTKATATNNSQTLKVSPVRSSVIIKAGASGIVQTFVTNLTKAPINIQPIENDFVAGDESGNPALILDPNSYAPTHSLKRFMAPLKSFTIPAEGTQQVNVTINVPKSAQAGGYFGAVRFAPGTGSGGQNVNLNASVASLILLTVPGPTTEKLTLTNFDIQQDGGTATNFRKPDNLALFLRFKNEGNLQESPFGQVYVRKDKKVLYSYNFNQAEPKSQILPDSARRWNVPLKGFGKFGKYTIGGTFSYGVKGQSVEIVKTVWIIPTAIIMAIIIGVLVLGALILGTWIFLRNYKRRILKSSRRRY
jgi:hypothetical protein